MSLAFFVFRFLDGRAVNDCGRIGRAKEKFHLFPIDLKDNFYYSVAAGMCVFRMGKMWFVLCAFRRKIVD